MDIMDNSLDASDEKDVDVEILGRGLVSATPLTIVEEEASLSPDDSGTLPQLLEGDEEITYQLRSAEGVTYRVVSVGSEDIADELPQIVTTNGTSFNSSSSDSQGIPALLTSAVSGQLYVIGSSQEVFSQQNQRNIVPRSPRSVQVGSVNTATSSPQCRPRDDRRRATHNEVERRRRDKINNWIMKLSKIIPDCSQDSGKGFETQSKGGILAKACDYIVELKSSNLRLMEYTKENDQLVADLETVMKQLEDLKRENNQLRAQLVENGISPCLDPITITGI